MSITSFFGSQIVVVPNLSSKKLGVEGKCNVGLVIENSSRPQKKATAHHMKTRPRKTQPWDVNRKPTVYPPLPPLPPDWTLVSDDTDTDASAAAPGADATEPAALEAPLASG